MMAARSKSETRRSEEEAAAAAASSQPAREKMKTIAGTIACRWRRSKWKGGSAVSSRRGSQPAHEQHMFQCPPTPLTCRPSVRTR